MRAGGALAISLALVKSSLISASAVINRLGADTRDGEDQPMRQGQSHVSLEVTGGGEIVGVAEGRESVDDYYYASLGASDGYDYDYSYIYSYSYDANLGAVGDTTPPKAATTGGTTATTTKPPAAPTAGGKKDASTGTRSASDVSSLICPFFATVLKEGALKVQDSYTRKELMEFSLLAGIDEGDASEHLESNFRNVPSNTTDLFFMEGFPNEHKTSTGILDCRSSFPATTDAKAAAGGTNVSAPTDKFDKFQKDMDAKVAERARLKAQGLVGGFGGLAEKSAASSSVDDYYDSLKSADDYNYYGLGSADEYYYSYSELGADEDGTPGAANGNECASGGTFNKLIEECVSPTPDKTCRTPAVVSSKFKEFWKALDTNEDGNATVKELMAVEKLYDSKQCADKCIVPIDLNDGSHLKNPRKSSSGSVVTGTIMGSYSALIEVFGETCDSISKERMEAVVVNAKFPSGYTFPTAPKARCPVGKAPPEGYPCCV